MKSHQIKTYLFVGFYFINWFGQVGFDLEKIET